jgi:hypothetical protein
VSKQAWIILAVIAGVGLLSCACCGVGALFFGLPKIREAADRAKRTNDLKALALAIVIFQDDKKRGPADIDELAAQLSPDVVQRVRNRDISVVWKAARMSEQPAGGSNVVVAWESRLEPNGTRLVVYLDGHPEILPEQEFQQKPKAQTK